MAAWNNENEMFELMKEKLYTPVVGDILDQMGYKHQFLPASIRPLAAQVPTAPYILPGEEEDKRLKVAGYACTVLENDVFEYPAEKPVGYMTEALDDLKPNEIYIATGAHNSALWGELLTACGKARGAVGAVLDGYTRDTPKVIEQNFPVFCSGTWAQDSSVRTYVFKWRCPTMAISSLVTSTACSSSPRILHRKSSRKPSSRQARKRPCAKPLKTA